MGQDTVSDKRVGAVRSTDGMGPLENRDPKEPAEYLVVRWPSWLPKTFRSSWLASVVVAAYVVLFLVSLVRSPYFGPLATVDEQLMYYQVARTFNEHGFLNSAFLQDFSSSSNPDHHPFVYNHMPPGPELFTSLLMKVFGEQFQLIRVVFVAIFVVGVAYYLKFVSLLLDRLALRGAGFALLLIPPYVMLHTVDHPAYSPFPFIGFFPLVAFDHYHRTGRRRWYWGALLVVLIGSLYLVYQQLFMLFASWALLGLLRVIRLERREVLTLLFTGGLGIVLHLLQSVILLGPQTFAEELGLTISNRMFGVPATGELRAFYQTIAVVHQGFHQLDPQMLWDILRRSVRPAGERQLKDLVLALMAGGLILALLRSVPLEREQASIRIRRGEVTQALHLLSMSLLWVLGAVIIPLLMFPAYAASYQLSGANHFLLAAVAILGVSYAATESVRSGQRWIRRAEPRSWRWMASLGVLGLVLTALIAFGNTVIREQTRQFRERMQHVFRDGRQKELFELVEPLRGRVVMTNVYPSVVGFFSREATLGGCEIEAFPPDGHFNHVRNDDFENWDSHSQLPVAWYVSGSSVRIEPDEKDPYRGRMSARFAVGADQIGQVRQWVLLPRRPEPEKLAAGVWVRASAPRRVRVYVGGAAPNFSSFHPGDGSWRLLVGEVAMPRSVIEAPRIQVGVQVEAGDPTVVNVDWARLFDGVSSEASAVASANDALVGVSTPGSPQVRPLGFDPSRCHAVWIRGYPTSTAMTPTHYVLFRGFFTGFTLCREAECLDRFERYVSSRYPIVFQNSLGTVFALGTSALSR